MPEDLHPSLLIVDDDPLITETLSYALGKDFEVMVSDSRHHAVSLLRQLDEAPQLALVDLGLPPIPHRPDEGFQLISDLLAHSPTMKILVLSGQNDAANARHARTLGAAEFVAKPCDPENLKKILLHALQFRAAEISGEGIAEADPLVGKSPALQKLKSQISQYADSPFPALIEGESGTGKEVVANLLHRLSWRRVKPWFALNCAAIAPTLVEPTLFGYTKGAFTGATQNKSGYFEDASDGTLFLDEIGELPLELQAKLLRVLENGEFQRVGETQQRFSRSRVIAATNRDLRQEVRKGNVRAEVAFPPPIATCARKSGKATSARTCITGCRFSRSKCRRCARWTRTARCCSSTTVNSTRSRRSSRRSRWTIRRKRPGATITFPATCASCATSSSGSPRSTLGRNSRLRTSSPNSIWKRRPTEDPDCRRIRERSSSRRNAIFSASAASISTRCSRPGNRGTSRPR